MSVFLSLLPGPGALVPGTVVPAVVPCSRRASGPLVVTVTHGQPMWSGVTCGRPWAGVGLGGELPS